MQIPFPIIPNHETMTITVGPKVFDRPVLYRAPEIHFSLKAQIIPSDLWRPKDLHHYYCERLGPKFNRRFQAANYYFWVHGRFTKRTANILRQDGRHWRSYSDDLVWKANVALPYVNEAERDGLFNLIPLIVTFEESPHQIMKRVGRGAWRRLASNSLSRNCKIMQAVERYRRVRDNNNDDKAEYVSKLIDVPSGVMRGMYLGSDEEFIAAKLTPKRQIETYIHTRHLVEDAMRMLGLRFNPNWSLARITAEHHEAAKEHNRGRFSAKHFAEAWSFEADGYSATLLISPLDIAAEGQTQHHCVASYAGMAQRGVYTVFRVEGKERATLGLQTDGRYPLVDQIYGACNSLVSVQCRDFCHKLAAEYDKARGSTARAA